MSNSYTVTVTQDNDILVEVGAPGIAGPGGPTGSKGDTGLTGADGTNGTNGTGVPSGGTVNQVLEKIDGTDYNTQWATPVTGVTDHTLLTNIGTNTHAQIDSHIADGTLHFTQASISITESQISDLQSYSVDTHNHTLDGLSNTTITTIASGELLKWSGTAWINNTLAEASISATGHTHTESEISDLGTYIPSSEKAAANGVATLDANSKINTSQLPAITITDTFVVVSQIAMLALTAETGDVAVRSDENKSYILKGTDPSVLGDWQILLTPTDSVLSVAGKTGTVTLVEADITDLGTYETAFTKNTGFNKNLGTIAGTVSEGDHTHSGTYEPADATILKDADIGVNVQAYDATYVVDADIGVTVEAYNANIQTHIGTTTGNPHSVSASDVSLGNVTNTSDANKPVSTAQQTALDLKGDKHATFNAQTGTTYTAVLTDDDKMVTMNNAGANTLTIPANASVAYPVGTKLNFMQLGAGATTIAITTDTLSVNATLTLVLDGQYAVATALKLTSTSWVLFGNLVAA